MKLIAQTLFILVVALLSFGCALNTENEVQKQIDSSIPVGSLKKDVIKFLEHNSFIYTMNPKDGVPTDCGECDWMRATLEQRIMWRKHFIVVDLFFNRQDDVLLKYKVSTSYPASSF